ncbi:hypothetical protein V8E36_003934 [Tilletia maclaganii]
MFSFSQPQQQQQQQAPGGFTFGQPQQQQQQPGLFGGGANPATPGPLSVNDLGRQQPQQQAGGGGGGGGGGFGLSFGAQAQQPQMQQQQPQAGGGLFGPPQPQQQPAQAQYGAGSAFGSRPGGMGHPGLSHSASSGSLYGSVGGAGVGVPGSAGQSNPVYVPGYLSKIRSNKPYASSRRISGHHSPTNDDDGNTSRDMDGRGAAASPTNPFQSSFFAVRSPSAAVDDPRASARAESIFGPGGLRGNRRSVGPGGGSVGGGAGGTDDNASLRGSVGPGGLRRSASGVFGGGAREASVLAMDDDDDLPPVQGLREADDHASFAGLGGAAAGGTASASGLGASNGFGSSRNGFDHSLHAGRCGASTASRVSPVNGAANSSGQAGISSKSASSSSVGSSSDPTRTLLVFGFPAAAKTAVLHFFESIGEIVALTPVSSLDYNATAEGGQGGNGFDTAAQFAAAQFDALQITYAEQWCALRALRRNGDVVAGAGCRIGIRFANENLHREVVQNGINSAVLVSAGNTAVLASGGDVGDVPGRGVGNPTAAPASASASTLSGTTGSGLESSTSMASGLGAQARQKRESTPAFGRPISMVATPSLVLRTPGSGGGGGGSGVSSSTGSPFAKAAANIFGGGGGGGTGTPAGGARSGAASNNASPAAALHGHGRSASAIPPSSLFRTALTNSPATNQQQSGAAAAGGSAALVHSGAGGGNSAAAPAGGQGKPGAGAGGLGQRLSDAIFGW